MTTEATPAKLSDERLTEIRETAELWNAQHGAAIVRELIASHDAITAELAAANADNARLARERDDWKASFENQSSELRRLSDEMADHEDAIEHLRSIGKAIGCNHVNCPDERAMIVRCVEQTVDALQYQLDLAAKELIETKQQLADAQQRLAALAVDPAKREELAMDFNLILERRIGIAKWDNCELPWKEAVLKGVDYLVAKGRLSRDAEVERLKRAFCKQSEDVCQLLGSALGYPKFCDDQQNFPGTTDSDGVCVGEHVAVTLAAEAAEKIVELKQQLAALAEPKDAEALARIACKNAGTIPLDRLTDDQKRKTIAGIKAVSAHVRAPLVQQNAELTGKLAAAEKRLKVNELDMIATANETNCPTEWEPTPGHVVQLVPFGRMRAGLHKLKADRDRLAAELALYTEACGQLSDLVDELESTLEDEETSHQDTIRIWDIAKEQLATTKQALAAKTSELERLRGAIEEEGGGFLNLLDGLDLSARDRGRSDAAWASRCLMRLRAALEHCRATAPAAAEPPVADHFVDAAEKVEAAQPERRFVCPACGGEDYVEITNYDDTRKRVECISDSDPICHWSGTWA